MVQHRLEQHTTWLENQDSNVFFADGVVSAIIDWDKAEVRSRGHEVVLTTCGRCTGIVEAVASSM
jgi:hypothetical protein